MPREPLDKVARDICEIVQTGVRFQANNLHNQQVEVKWMSPQTLILTAKRVSGDRKFTVTVKELP